MDIRFFIYSLLTLSIISYFIPINSVSQSENIEEFPHVIFEKPLMYTITDEQITRVVEASYAVRYKNRDEMFNANIMLRNQKENKDFLFEKLKADLIVKKGSLYELAKNVRYSRDFFITFDTEEFFYDSIKKVGYNSKPYEGVYYQNFIKGNSIYVDLDNNFIKSKNTHLKLDIKN